MALGALLARWRRPRLATSGYIYVPAAEAGPLTSARPGATVAIEGRGPPWIVVDHELERVIVPSWPGRLLHVRVAEAASEKEQNRLGGAPRAEAAYTRAVSIEVIDELPAHTLFGPQGAAVASVIEATATITPEMAKRLSEFRHGEIAEACARVWQRWMAQSGIDRLPVSDWVGTLAVPGNGLASPVNAGLMVTQKAMFDQAVAEAGADATQTEGDNVWLVEPWNGAALAAVEAAMAFGAPKVCGRWDARILSHAWLSVFGRR